jgi:hypothetical protein
MGTHWEQKKINNPPFLPPPQNLSRENSIAIVPLHPKKEKKEKKLN